jgi:hypothetical protein
MSPDRLAGDNGPPPQKKERGVGTALKTVERLTAYHTLHFLQAPFGFVFWLIEQRKAQLQDQIDNEESL